MKMTPIAFEEYDCYKVSGVQGESFIWDVPSGVDDLSSALRNVAQFPVYAEGTCDVVLEAEPNVVQHRSAGWAMTMPSFSRPVSGGRTTTTITSPTFSYYCIKDRKNRALSVYELRLSNGETGIIPLGKNVLLAVGKCVVKGVSYSAPTQFLTDADMTVQADGDCLAIVLNRAAP
jgi:hypothetical protein